MVHASIIFGVILGCCFIARLSVLCFLNAQQNSNMVHSYKTCVSTVRKKDRITCYPRSGSDIKLKHINFPISLLIACLLDRFLNHFPGILTTGRTSYSRASSWKASICAGQTHRIHSVNSHIGYRIQVPTHATWKNMLR